MLIIKNKQPEPIVFYYYDNGGNKKYVRIKGGKTTQLADFSEVHESSINDIKSGFFDVSNLNIIKPEYNIQKKEITNEKTIQQLKMEKAKKDVESYMLK